MERRKKKVNSKKKKSKMTELKKEIFYYRFYHMKWRVSYIWMKSVKADTIGAKANLYGENFLWKKHCVGAEAIALHHVGFRDIPEVFMWTQYTTLFIRTPNFLVCTVQ